MTDAAARNAAAVELRAMLRLALPVAAVRVGLVLMGVVDATMVGHLSPAALAVQRSVVLALALLPAGPVLGASGQPTEVAPTAAAFVRAQVDGVPPFLGSSVLMMLASYGRDVTFTPFRPATVRR